MSKNKSIEAVINPESFIIEKSDDESFKTWLNSQGLDDPDKMFDAAAYLLLRKYESAKLIEYLDKYQHEGFAVYRFKITNHNGKEYIQGSWQLLRGF